jgi:hypothetical protein
MLPASLLHDTTQCADWDVPFGMRHRYSSTRSKRMNEMMVTATSAKMTPSIALEPLNDLATVHFLTSLTFPAIIRK